MGRDIVHSTRAPEAVGPYSQAVGTDGMLFVSGQLPIDPETGTLSDLEIGDQTRKVLDNLRAILEEAGSSLADIVKTTIYLADMGTFGTVNKAYGDYFPKAPPARVCIEAARLPKDARIMVDCIAARPR